MTLEGGACQGRFSDVWFVNRTNEITMIARKQLATAPAGQRTLSVGSDFVPTDNDPNFMTSLARGLSVIRAFTDQEPNLTIAEVARLAGISRAAARRCLYTLAQLGYAGSDGRTFCLRPKMLTLGYAFLSSAALPQVLQPFLERVSATLRESSSAAVLEDGEIVYIARASTQRIMSMELSVGSRLPAYCTAMGRVLLAHLPADQLMGYLKSVQLEPLTELTITRRDELRHALDVAREQGYALVDQELEVGLVSIAVPVRNVGGGVVAAMNVSLQAARVAPGDMDTRYLPVLREAADEIKVR
jgi:IclR family pca regulon transcriptional regulator